MKHSNKYIQWRDAEEFRYGWQAITIYWIKMLCCNVSLCVFSIPFHLHSTNDTSQRTQKFSHAYRISRANALMHVWNYTHNLPTHTRKIMRNSEWIPFTNTYKCSHSSKCCDKKKTKKNSLFFCAYNAKSIKSCAGSQLLYPLRVVWTDSTPHSSNKQNHEIFSLHDNFDDSVCSAICTAPAISPTPPPCDDMPGYMYIVQRTVVQSM